MSRRNIILANVAGLLGAAVVVPLVFLLTASGSGPDTADPPAVHYPPDSPPQRDSALSPQVPPTATGTATASPSPTADPTASPNPTQTSTATPEPRSGECRPGGPEPVAEAQVLSYYGHPYTPDMGILGELEPETLVARLKEHAATYDELNGPRAVQPALHIVYASAQSEPYDGSYLLYVDEETLREYIDLACQHGLLIFLDLQIGRSDVGTEVADIMPYLEQPHVHVAVDPEFAMPAGEVPGQTIGSLDATEVNAGQAILQDLLEQNPDLPDKILVVHQFTEDMLTRPELLEDYGRVRLVIDMDGFGPARIKRVKYGWYAEPAENSGIKLFFKQDEDLMTEAEVLKLKPDVIIYQ